MTKPRMQGTSLKNVAIHKPDEPIGLSQKTIKKSEQKGTITLKATTIRKPDDPIGV